MAIVPKVGYRKGSVFAFLASSYLLLTIGALSMVIPFMIMLTSAFSNEWDYEKFNLVPTYLWNRPQRYMKFITEKYADIRDSRIQINRDFRLFSAAYHPQSHWTSFRAMREDKSFDEIRPFKFGSEVGRENQLTSIYKDYCEWITAYDQPLLTLPMFARLMRVRYQETLFTFYKEAFLRKTENTRVGRSERDLEQGALETMAEVWQEAKFKHFFFVEMIAEGSYPYHLRAWLPAIDEPRLQDYFRFVRTLPPDWKVPITAQHLWVQYLESSAGRIEDFSQATGMRIQSYHEVVLPDTKPTSPVLKALWQDFSVKKWPLWMVKLPDAMRPEYLDYLNKRAGSLDRFNHMVQSHYRSWDEVPFTGIMPMAALERNIWRDFLQSIPPEIIAKHRYYPEQSYRAFLSQRYGTVEGLNRAYGWKVGNFNEVSIPIADVDYAQFLDQESQFLKNFLTFNFSQVFKYMTLQNRAVFNTLLLVFLSILSCLIINPLAAYALSRFRIKGTHKILLFLLATMAFPAEVAMIPNFILLRDLGLLNTFAALILPSLASGFGIFLLKGFFDSLPKELYEAATIDGAKEYVIFTRITLPLCKPILAYHALLSFMGTYGGFMWAFLVCQDTSMWTLMVWIYQYQQTAVAFPYMVMAAFVLASIPTLLVFLFCQRIILQGIVIPSMK
jgi:ABC-type glycerol-3-phosphate transport system permease component